MLLLQSAFVFRTTQANAAAGETVVIIYRASASTDIYAGGGNIVDNTFILVSA